MSSAGPLSVALQSRISILSQDAAGGNPDRGGDKGVLRSARPSGVNRIDLLHKRYTEMRAIGIENTGVEGHTCVQQAFEFQLLEAFSLSTTDDSKYFYIPDFQRGYVSGLPHCFLDYF